MPCLAGKVAFRNRKSRSRAQPYRLRQPLQFVAANQPSPSPNVEDIEPRIYLMKENQTGMPGTFVESLSKGQVMPCARCRVLDAVLVVRTEHLCRDCFLKYVATKVSKRIETNKLRGAFKETPKTLLLPVSLGVSSVSLMWVLNQQLASQHGRNGKALFKLHVLFIAHPHSSGNAQCHEAFHLLKQRFPSHMYSSIPLEDMFDYDINIDNEILNIRAGNPELTTGNPELTNQERLEQVLLSLPSATSKADVESLLRLRLVVAFAKRNSCDSVIWGDSTTRLAERTLSEAAKGRGGSLPWLTADGLSPYGVKLSYPMRDLLKKELMAFATMTLPPLTDLIVVTRSSAQASASSKDTTIDDLMSQYFESVEENFPSIVANVVRTSSRLVAPAVKPNEPSCCVCGLPIVMRFQEWGGNQESVVNNADMAEETVEADGSLCYGCARSALNPSGNSSTT